MSRAVFTYGTLLFPEVFEAVTGRVFVSLEAAVTGLVRYGVRDAVFPGVVVGRNDRLEGRVYLDVDPRTLARLDRFEDVLYERRAVEAHLADGRTLAADAWVVPPRHAGELDGAPWDPETFRRRHLSRYLEMCRAFRVEDEAHHHDPD